MSAREADSGFSGAVPVGQPSRAEGLRIVEGSYRTNRSNASGKVRSVIVEDDAVFVSILLGGEGSGIEATLVIPEADLLGWLVDLAADRRQEGR